MKDYVINSSTLAIIPIDSSKSLVYEGETSFIVNKRPNVIIKKNCLYYGSTYEGRVKCTEILTGYSYKAPILVKEEENLIFFPTTSPRLKDCGWLSLNNIEKLDRSNDQFLSRVVFYNKLFIKLPVSFNILNNQILRSTQLEAKLRKNKA